MLFDSAEPISVHCAQTIGPAIDSLLRLGIVQDEFVEHLSRALGIVRCVLDHHQSIPRKKLAVLGRSLWARVPQIPNVPNDAVEQVRSIIMACVGELRELPELPAAHLERVLPSAPASSPSTQPDHAGQATAVKEPRVTNSQPTRSAIASQPSNGIGQRQPVEQKVERLLAEHDAGNWMTVKIEAQEEAEYLQAKSGRPNSKTQYVKKTRDR